MRLEEVKYWIIESGRGHVVVEARGMLAWSETKTVCGLSLRNHWPVIQRPDRICRKCKQDLEDFITAKTL